MEPASTRRAAPRLRLLAWLLVLAGAWSVAAVESLAVRVHRTIPHDAEAFTQGLLWWDGKLYESTGRRGHSELRQLDPATGRVQRRASLPVFYFGEGLARFEDRLVMLTWHAERAFVFRLDDFGKLATHAYSGQGWGLCHDGSRFVMSDGSHRLTFRDSESFAAIGAVAVTLDGVPLALLNELECVGDAVYANVFQHDFLVRIDPVSGRATQRIDASGLLSAEAARRADVLNGIAYDPAAKRFYLTGKLWPTMFEATFETRPPRDSASAHSPTQRETSRTARNSLVPRKVDGR